MAVAVCSLVGAANDYSKEKYGLKSWSGKHTENCLKYAIKYLKPITYTGSVGWRGINNTGYTSVPDFNGLLTQFVEFFMKGNDIIIFRNK